VDLNIVEPLTNGFRYAEGLPMFKDRMRCLPEAADGLKAVAQDKIAFLDAQLEGRDYIVDNRFTLADVLLFCFLAFGEQVGQPLNRDYKNVARWFDHMAQRDSAGA
jgi:glutathione S-transferase